MNALVPYLNFDGNCRQAMTFYKNCLGADLHLTSFGDMAGAVPGGVPDAVKDRIMHARLSNGAVTLMASDTMLGMPFQKGTNFSVSVHPESGEEIERLWTAFSEGATIQHKLDDAPLGSALRDAHRPVRGSVDVQLRVPEGRVACAWSHGTAGVVPTPRRFLYWTRWLQTSLSSRNVRAHKASPDSVSGSATIRGKGWLFRPTENIGYVLFRSWMFQSTSSQLKLWDRSTSCCSPSGRNTIRVADTSKESF